MNCTCPHDGPIIVGRDQKCPAHGLPQYRRIVGAVPELAARFEPTPQPAFSDRVKPSKL